MGTINRHLLPRSAAIVDIYDRTDAPFGKLSIIHPSHPMYKAQTIRVDSLKDMVRPINIGVPIAELIDDTSAFDYAIFDWVSNKPDLNIVLDNGYQFVYRIASTTTIPEDSQKSVGVDEAVKGLLYRRLDAIEAVIWFMVFLDYAVWPPLYSDPASYREIFALARALLSRMAPSDAFDVMLSPKSYGAALLENAVGTGNNSNYTEPQVASGSLTLVPIAFNESIFSYFDFLCVYPSYLPTLCKRYIYEKSFAERVLDSNEDRNLYRLTAERYVLIVVPTDYYSYYQGYYVAPIVGLWTNEALRNIINTFGGGVYNNLEVVSRIG
jgi:hypothetical protein